MFSAKRPGLKLLLRVFHDPMGTIFLNDFCGDRSRDVTRCQWRETCNYKELPISFWVLLFWKEIQGFFPKKAEATVQKHPTGPETVVTKRLFFSSLAEGEIVDALSRDRHQICTCVFPTPCVSLNTLENLGIHFMIPQKSVQTWWNAIFRAPPPAVYCTCVHLQGGLSESPSWHIKLSSTMVATVVQQPFRF